MGKRIIYTEDDSSLGAEIEAFVNQKGTITIMIKYENDCDAEVRCIVLSTEDFDEMVSNVIDEINETKA